MIPEPVQQVEPRIQNVVDELKAMILRRYPEVTFEVERSLDDPEAIHLTTTVDVEDTDEVVDLVIDRVLELQVEERVPIHVIPVRPLERVLTEMQSRRSARPGPRCSGQALLR